MINPKIIIEQNDLENKLNELLLKINFIKNNYKSIDVIFTNDSDTLVNNINNCLKLIDKNIIQYGSLQRNNKYY
jgi:hypothetical protein